MDNLPQRKRIRLHTYDYSQNGAYFITICTKGRYNILADICRGGALLRPIGMIAEHEIQNLPERFGITIPKYVVMPNHIHLIIIIARAEQSPANITRAEQSPAPTVCNMVCAFKSITTKIANGQDRVIGRQIWQRSYHDHIIRNEQEYQKIWEYIDTNPLKWEEDRYYG